ncbi:MAG: RNA-directed DNA polymerase, partial [Blastocatellia bacterium]|nr:RNA-directed DNA polymerase [Blastocatellia bacterium]
MKRHGDLWPRITNFGNLLSAARKARRGKRSQRNVLAFDYNLENYLIELQDALLAQTYQPGSYTTFTIVEPKKRMISAAPYGDRVVHHALCNVIAPIFERTFTGDSFANRKGFGSHRALGRFKGYARRYRYVLQCDVRKYFPSIDHEILKTTIRRKIKCPRTLWLIDTIIDASNVQEEVVHFFPGDDLFTPYERRRGLPIGNLTSQFFANLYLNGFDHFIREGLRAPAYVRYVDDFALFSDDREYLREARRAIEARLAELRLRIHPVKSQLFETRCGASFLGFRVLPDRVRVRAENLQRARRRLRLYQAQFRTGGMSLDELTQCLRSWIAHLAHGDTWQLRKEVFRATTFSSPRLGAPSACSAPGPP